MNDKIIKNIAIHASHVPELTTQIDVGAALSAHMSGFTKLPSLLQRLCKWGLRRLVYEGRINKFLAAHGHRSNFDFIDNIFETLSFTYQYSTFRQSGYSCYRTDDNRG